MVTYLGQVKKRAPEGTRGQVTSKVFYAAILKNPFSTIADNQKDSAGGINQRS